MDMLLRIVSMAGFDYKVAETLLCETSLIALTLLSVSSFIKNKCRKARREAPKQFH